MPSKTTKKSVQKRNVNGLRRLLSNSRIRLPAILFILLFAGVGSYFLLRSYAATPQGTYTNWNWSPPAEGYNSLEHALTVEAVTTDAPYFWSHQYQFVGGDGGYIGLQSHGSRVNGTVGKTAVFSIFSAGIEATPGACQVQQASFDGGTGAGSSCRIPYEWVIGHTYQMRTARMGADATGTWWGGWVKDTSTGVETFIAQIKVPLAWKGIGAWSVMWTEYFGAQPSSCDLLPYSRVRFNQPTANGGTVVPTSTSDFLSTSSTCTNSKITDVTSGVIQEMGNASYQAPAPTPPPPATDTQAPSVSIAQPQAGSTITGTVQINASSLDNIGVVKMQVYIDGTLIKTSTFTAGTTNSISASWQPTSKGKAKKSHTIRVTATDAAGNVGSKSVSFYTR
jgi:hypothetical protein